MSSLSTAPAERGARTARAPAPASNRRRVSKRETGGWVISIGSIGVLFCPRHVFGVEGQLNFFPAVIVLRPEHIEGLTRQNRADRAIARRHSLTASAVHPHAGAP